MSEVRVSDETLEAIARAIYRQVALPATQSPEHFAEYRNVWIKAAEAAVPLLLAAVGLVNVAAPFSLSRGTQEATK